MLLASLVQAPDGGWESIGSQEVTITDPVQLETPLSNELGSITVDLRGLELDRDRDFRITNEVGSVRVLLPTGLDVDANCRSDVGSVDCPDPSADTDGPVLTLDISNNVGSVKVTR